MHVGVYRDLKSRQLFEMFRRNANADKSVGERFVH